MNTVCSCGKRRDENCRGQRHDREEAAFTSFDSLRGPKEANLLE